MDTQTAAVALKTAKLALANGVTVNGQISGAINLLARLGKAPQQADWVESRIAAAATSYDNLTAQSCMLELQAFRSSDDAMVYQKAVSVYQVRLFPVYTNERSHGRFTAALREAITFLSEARWFAHT